MAIVALSPNSIMANPAQANQQVRNDIQISEQRLAQDAQKAAKKIQTDTITISAQALKMADEKETSAKDAVIKDNEQREFLTAQDTKSSIEKTAVQQKALNAYTSIGR